MTEVILIAGLGFGDEGKGSVVDYLTLPGGLVIRYGGGAQAAHNVVRPDGTHHTFSQFGSGTFNGAHTHLSRYMLVNPLSLLNEARALNNLIKGNVLDGLTIDREALITNVFQIAANRLRETLRSGNRHGSCGMGIGETVKDALEYPDMALRVGDLTDLGVVTRKLRFSRDLKRAEFEDLHGIEADDKNKQLLEKSVAGLLAEKYFKFGRIVQMVDRDWLIPAIKKHQTVVFEGAQGVLLDQDYGFFPYVTRSKTTFDNALSLLEGFDGPVRKMGILRAYHTRHGAGPFPTEEESPHVKLKQWAPDNHNVHGEWQKAFRIGYFDTVLARYALEVIKGVDELAITNIDKLLNHQCVYACESYSEYNDEIVSRLPIQQTLNFYECVKGEDASVDLSVQERLGSTLMKVTPNYKVFGSLREFLIDTQEQLETPLNLMSAGPTHQEKFPGPITKWFVQNNMRVRHG